MMVNIKIEMRNFESGFGHYHNEEWIPGYSKLEGMLTDICQDLFKDSYTSDFKIISGENDERLRQDIFIAEICVDYKVYSHCLDFFPKSIYKYYINNNIKGNGDFIKSLFFSTIKKSFDPELDLTYKQVIK